MIVVLFILLYNKWCSGCCISRREQALHYSYKCDKEKLYCQKCKHQHQALFCSITSNRTRRFSSFSSKQTPIYGVGTSFPLLSVFGLYFDNGLLPRCVFYLCIYTLFLLGYFYMRAIPCMFSLHSPTFFVPQFRPFRIETIGGLFFSAGFKTVSIF